MSSDLAQAARDHLAQPHIKKKRPFSWLPPLPTLTWCDDAEVTPEAQQKILGLLTEEAPDTFDPDVWQIFGALHAMPRIAWAEEIEAQWLAHGAKPAHKWAIFQLAAMGARRRLGERAVELIELATHGNHKRALWYLEAMSRVDDPELRSWLFDLSIHAPYKSTLQRDALTWHNHLVAVSPLTPTDYLATLNLYIREEHIESHIPMLDFVPDETALTLHEQTYLITFLDDSFELGLRHASTRKLTPGFPAQDLHHDPTTWRRAHDTFLALSSTLTPFIAQWQGTFERAMISARPYTHAYIATHFLSNRLMSHLVESLVWMIDGGATVRLLEGSCFDVNYDEVTLAQETTLKLVHPLEISPEDAQKWGNQLAEDETFPLFPQLTRELFNPQDHPFAALRAHLDDAMSSAFVVLLGEQGWRHGEVTSGNFSESYQLLPGRDARVWLSHGTLSFQDALAAYTYNRDKPGIYKVYIEQLSGRRLAEAEIDAVVYSEAYTLVETFAVAMHLLTPHV